MRNMFIAIVIVVVYLISCSIRSDISDVSWAGANYYSTHFQFNGENYFGILPVNLQESEPLPRDAITIKMFHEGTMHFFSRSCELNYSARFRGDYLFKVPHKRNCEITVTIMPDAVKGMQHSYVEKGLIITHVRKNDEWSMLVNNRLQQNAIQVLEGIPSEYEQVKLRLYSQSGIIIGNSSTGKQFEMEYNNNEYVSLPLRQLLCDGASSCTWYFRAIAFDEPLTRVGRLEISVYKPIMPLEEPAIRIRKIFGQRYMEFTPGQYIVGTDVNGEQFFKGTVQVEYNWRKSYMITSVTKAGRKSVIIYQNGVVIWSSLN